MKQMGSASVGVVVIGRNEGERLRRCLASLGDVATRVYVDSGSTDGSQALAQASGFELVDLDTSKGFTAARARNAGLHRLLQIREDLDYVQFIDGDCELRPDWIATALEDFEPSTAVVFGRRRERFPEKNLYHRACDIEWAVPSGFVASCGGDALFRVTALQQAGGYNDAAVAGEEPELCLRLRRLGWRVYSNAREMTLHDVDIDRMGQWWRRAKRTGFGFGALVSLHGLGAEPAWRRLLTSAIAWTGIALTVLVLAIAALVSRNPLLALVALSLSLLLTLAIGRTAWRQRASFRNFGQALEWSALLYLAKVAQVQGLLSLLWQRLRARPARIIEYK